MLDLLIVILLIAWIGGVVSLGSIAHLLLIVLLIVVVLRILNGRRLD